MHAVGERALTRGSNARQEHEKGGSDALVSFPPCRPPAGTLLKSGVPLVRAPILCRCRCYSGTGAGRYCSGPRPRIASSGLVAGCASAPTPSGPARSSGRTSVTFAPCWLA